MDTLKAAACCPEKYQHHLSGDRAGQCYAGCCGRRSSLSHDIASNCSTPITSSLARTVPRAGHQFTGTSAWYAKPCLKICRKIHCVHLHARQTYPLRLHT